MEFKLAQSDNVREFERQVARLLNSGYKFHGKIFKGYYRYNQAMVKGYNESDQI